MYIRQAKQFLRNIDASFDERKFGFASLVDLLRACQRDGLFRIERDRQGVMRVFPGNIMQAADRPEAAGDDDNRGNVAEPQPADETPVEEWSVVTAASTETEVVEGDVVQEINAPPVVDGEATPEPEPEAQPAAAAPAKGRSRGGRGKSAGGAKAGGDAKAAPQGRRKAADAGSAKPRKAPAKPRAPRPRAHKETPAL
jgi:ribonuclease E